VLVPSLV